jgi:hypothetical protein
MKNTRSGLEIEGLVGLTAEDQMKLNGGFNWRAVEGAVGDGIMWGLGGAVAGSLGGPAGALVGFVGGFVAAVGSDMAGSACR